MFERFFWGVKESENVKVNECKLSGKDLYECWMTKGICVTERGTNVRVRSEIRVKKIERERDTILSFLHRQKYPIKLPDKEATSASVSHLTAVNRLQL